VVFEKMFVHFPKGLRFKKMGPSFGKPVVLYPSCIGFGGHNPPYIVDRRRISDKISSLSKSYVLNFGTECLEILKGGLIH
jgi:hypothetical protein